MHKRPIDIRCDGGTNIGMGHVVRCSALADMLREDFDIRFILRETSETVYSYITSGGFSYTTIPRHSDIDDAAITAEQLRTEAIVVLDGYQFDTEYQRQIKDAGHKIVAIDDLHAWHQLADIVINHAPNVEFGKYSAEPYTKLLLGTEYTLVRKEFYRNQKRKINNPVKFRQAIISMGASDIGNLTEKIALCLQELKVFEHIYLLVSRVNPHYAKLIELAESHRDNIHLAVDMDATALAELLAASDLMICPASTIAIESCCAGITLLTGTTAINQMDVHAGITSLGLGFSVGDFTAATAEQLTECINKILSSQDEVMLQLKSQRLAYQHPRASGVIQRIKEL